MSAEITGIRRDDEGYLLDPADWSAELARALAREESIELGDDHWIILNFLRDYHADHGIVPDIRHTARYFAEQTGVDKKRGKARIFELFPYGYVRQTCKIAGMRRPRAWSTG